MVWFIERKLESVGQSYSKTGNQYRSLNQNWCISNLNFQPCLLPGVELALFGSLLLEDASVFKLHRTGNEANFTTFFHQASYPPVVVEFLHKIAHDSYVEHPSYRHPYWKYQHLVGKESLTSLTWRKSLASKKTAIPGTGTSSS